MLYTLFALWLPKEISSGIGQNGSFSFLKRNSITKISIIFALCLFGGVSDASAQSRHNAASRFPSYEGLVMCGYQGWFRAKGDGSNEGWSHYSNHDSPGINNVHPDFWPDVSEYERTYPSPLTNKDGS